MIRRLLIKTRERLLELVFHDDYEGFCAPQFHPLFTSLAYASLLEIFAVLLALTVRIAGKKLRFLPNTRQVYL
jgi:hypothetical protein